MKQKTLMTLMAMTALTAKARGSGNGVSDESGYVDGNDTNLIGSAFGQPIACSIASSDASCPASQ